MKAPFQSIRIKLVLLLLAVGLIPLLVGTTVSYVTSTNALMEKVGQDLQLEAEHVTFAVEAIFTKAQSNLLIIAENSAFVMYFKEPRKQAFWRKEQEKALIALQRLYPEAQIKSTYMDLSGREISGVFQQKARQTKSRPTPELSSLSVRQISLHPGEVYQGPPYVSRESHLWYIPFIVPVTDGERTVGFLRLDIGLDYFASQLRGNISRQNHAFILERSGRILAQTIITVGETQGLPDVSDLDSSPPFQEIIRRALAGERNREYLTTSKGRKYLIAFQPTHSGHWSVLVFMPSPRVSAGILPMGKIPMIFVGTLMIILILAFFIGKRVAEPIKQVVSGTRTLSLGDFSHRILVRFNDELGELVDAFNTMAEHLQKREEEILWRNQELSSLNIIATSVNQSLDVEESLSAVLSKILEITRSSAGAIYLQKEKQSFACQVHSGIGKSLMEHFQQQKLGEGWVGLSARSGEPLIWNMASTDKNQTSFIKDGNVSPQPEKSVKPVPEELLRAGFQSFIGMPLRFKNKVNGVVCLMADTPDHFEPKTVELLSSICNQVGAAIENARLFANLEKAYEELKATHAQLIQSAKLAAVGELAAGVAHELNQPLMVIRGYTQEILDVEQKTLPESLQTDLKQIESQTSRMMRIIGHLRAFARQSSGSFDPVDINEIIKSSFTLVTQQLKNHNVSIDLNLGEKIPRVWGDATRLEQVFLNLITNARDAMEDRGFGTLRVATRVIYKETGLDTPVSSEVEVSFSDTGSGIPQKYLDKVFDPFFTTKEVGKGTGLGLSIGYSIIKDHGGSIRVESRIGVGTTFFLCFPVEKRRFPRKTGRGHETVTRRH